MQFSFFLCYFYSVLELIWIRCSHYSMRWKFKQGVKWKVFSPGKLECAVNDHEGPLHQLQTHTHSGGVSDRRSTCRFPLYHRVAVVLNALSLSPTLILWLSSQALTLLLLGRQVIESQDVSSWQQQRLVRPRRPIRHNNEPVLTLHHHTLLDREKKRKYECFEFL